MGDKRLVIKKEQDLRNTFDRMYKSAKETNKPFFNLTDLMMETETIMTAIHNIKSNKGSFTAGIDRKEINYYLQMEPDTLIRLIRKTIHSYNPKPVRRVYIPKKNSEKKRPLGIPTMLDRIIQEIARMVIEPIVEAKFFKHSYGFRPYRSTKHAVARIVDLINRGGYKFALEGDIEGFFDNINHNKLISLMWEMGIRDKRYLMIIKKMLRAGVMENGKVSISEKGSPQGGIISPVLANIYLNNFDWMIASEFEEHPARYKVDNPRKNGTARVKRRHSACYLIRYADDWIVLCETRKKAEQVYGIVDKYLKHVLKLNLSKEKTLITDLSQEPAKFLGFNIKAEKARGKDKIVGKPFINMKSLREKHRAILDDIKTVEHDFVDDAYLAYQIERINAKIIGIANYYNVGICNDTYNKLSWNLVNRMFKVFKRLKGEKWRDFYRPIYESNNRIERHKNSKRKTFMIKVDNVNIGLTQYILTKSERAMNFNQEMTPFTPFGRELRKKQTDKKPLLVRHSLYNENDLRFIAYKPKRGNILFYNFEYILNREYAFNRDKGKCKCCGKNLNSNTLRCHHKDPSLPMEKVNKVTNLISLCVECHNAVHGSELPNDDKVAKKIDKLKGYLKKQILVS
ncbi:group II intron reverse transcriptase/maturase [Niallia circulans]|uniref:group II intron reverse transcriptase/maturase n=1 Tax=Niallia circulans TaxID=1397 RepID=UPI0029003C3D|nr:group II intron reverse transcriptase/maturase [Niallia circulans]MDU1847425.1 group II intron reverse transcriptase/maturase [Niallia nealsonii]MED5102894.1 group II intron reverse transcriptase/maturase [Niallia circulans]